MRSFYYIDPKYGLMLLVIFTVLMFVLNGNDDWFADIKYWLVALILSSLLFL